MENAAISLSAPQGEISFATADLPGWQRKAVSLIEKCLGKKQLMQKYHHFLETNTGPEEFWDDVVDCLQLSVSTFGRDFSGVPESGPLVIVANHPFGLIDGAAICWLLSKRRKDFKVILWDVFKKKNNGEDYFLPLDLAEHCKEARRQNIQVRKTAIKHLQEGNAVLIFPSGSAERPTSLFGKPYELPWLPFTEKLILASEASVLPVFVHGHNSRTFHLASTFSETLRRAMFFYEIKRRINTEVELTLGEVVQFGQIEDWRKAQNVIPTLRDLTMSLSTTKVTHPKNNLLGPHAQRLDK